MVNKNKLTSWVDYRNYWLVNAQTGVWMVESYSSTLEMANGRVVRKDSHTGFIFEITHKKRVETAESIEHTRHKWWPSLFSIKDSLPVSKIEIMHEKWSKQLNQTSRTQDNFCSGWLSKKDSLAELIIEKRTNKGYNGLIRPANSKQLVLRLVINKGQTCWIYNWNNTQTRVQLVNSEENIQDSWCPNWFLERTHSLDWYLK